MSPSPRSPSLDHALPRTAPHLRRALEVRGRAQTSRPTTFITVGLQNKVTEIRRGEKMARAPGGKDCQRRWSPRKTRGIYWVDAGQVPAHFTQLSSATLAGTVHRSLPLVINIVKATDALRLSRPCGQMPLHTALPSPLPIAGFQPQVTCTPLPCCPCSDHSCRPAQGD